MCAGNETADDEAERVGALEERVHDEQQEELVVEDADCRFAGSIVARRKVPQCSESVSQSVRVRKSGEASRYYRGRRSHSTCIVDPRTVMIELDDAPSSHAVVVGSRRLEGLATATPPTLSPAAGDAFILPKILRRWFRLW